MVSWFERFRRRGTESVQKLLLQICLAVFLFSSMNASALAKFPCFRKNCNCCEHGTASNAAALTPLPMRVSPLAQQLQPNRVLIVAPLDRQDRLKEQRELMRYLATHLRSTMHVDVVECPQRVCEDMFPIRTGQFDERKLVALGRQFLVDTVLYCNVESIDAYCPMNLELQFLLVNVGQAVSIVSGTGHFDLADKATQNVFYQSFGADPEVDTTLKNSPTRLIEFSTSRVAGDLTRLWK